ncbi:MAG: hypothetical protein ACFFBD_15415 [Candidatus Hodarchaeota archaeon]
MKKNREESIKDEPISLEDFKPINTFLLELKTALKVLTQILEMYADPEVEQALNTLWNAFTNLTTVEIPVNLEAIDMFQENVTLMEKNAQLQQELTRAHEYIRQHIKEPTSDSTYVNASKPSLKPKKRTTSLFQRFRGRKKRL